MNIRHITKALSERGTASIIGQDTEYRRFAVAIPIVDMDGKLHVLFQVRAMTLRNQPGEISFPGGGIEDGEEALSAALRETCEELRICGDDIEVLGTGDILITQNNRIIYPFVVKIRGGAGIKPSQSEVDHIFYVPLDFFLNNHPLGRKVRIVTIPEEEFPYPEMQQAINYNWAEGSSTILFYKYKDYIIWGITAKILHNFIKIIQGQFSNISHYK